MIKSKITLPYSSETHEGDCVRGCSRRAQTTSKFALFKRERRARKHQGKAKTNKMVQTGCTKELGQAVCSVPSTATLCSEPCRDWKTPKAGSDQQGHVSAA